MVTFIYLKGQRRISASTSSWLLYRSVWRCCRAARTALATLFVANPVINHDLELCLNVFTVKLLMPNDDWVFSMRFFIWTIPL